jgi:hypothetical protein
MVHLEGDAGERGIAAPQNKEMKLTKPGQDEASQLMVSPVFSGRRQR